MTLESFRGGCLCGRVRYVVSGKPHLVSYCHCGSCRRSAAAPVVVWATFDQASFVFEKGEPRVNASSAGVERRFCGDCGTPLTYMADFLGGLVDVTVGSLDDPSVLPPQMHIWESKRLGWLEIPDDLPRHAEFPPLG